MQLHVTFAKQPLVPCYKVWEANNLNLKILPKRNSVLSQQCCYQTAALLHFFRKYHTIISPRASKGAKKKKKTYYKTYVNIHTFSCNTSQNLIGLYSDLGLNRAVKHWEIGYLLSKKVQKRWSSKILETHLMSTSLYGFNIYHLYTRYCLQQTVC